MEQRTPVEAGVSAEYLPFIETLLARSSTHGISSFLAEQRVIAADHVDRRKRTLQVFTQLGGGEFHESEHAGAS
ncbi:hypothetical protein ALP68_101078 [Pseudomonas ficuserectae]|uniref:Uncharacterized protein n=1 Tax=Pseudomonas savastanoi pv. phaseolicola TaxID=319 RepID=A0A0P9WMU7_PSESH|nr:Uncharacterized protein AC515_4118 [Pseudomonas savastanoi pv. phaseolicola]KPB67952.1 Uncharacterized protein AC508_2930 [Pseudomonas amygdali pv. mellea]KPB85459.1 Uncharacterized protein AC504_3607 [Pseudomonas syringae pv. maculicola]RMS33837.1 hypothetical protein ALP68_101078 [Pseudomonas ficuserectae]KPB45217.1 Uncharacterized protein AC513_4667 [Pseudomonas savastanoi pv. phaseolicola]